MGSFLHPLVFPQKNLLSPRGSRPAFYPQNCMCKSPDVKDLYMYREDTAQLEDLPDQNQEK